MNITVTPQKKRKQYLTLIFTLLVIDLAIIALFGFNLRESALLLIATPTLLNLVLKFIMPIMKSKAAVFSKEIETQLIAQEDFKIQEIKNAKKDGLKAYNVGSGKKHTVFAKTPFKAERFFKKRMAHICESNPTKVFYYVTEKYNNINE